MGEGGRELVPEVRARGARAGRRGAVLPFAGLGSMRRGLIFWRLSWRHRAASRMGPVATNPSLRQAMSALMTRRAPGSGSVVGEEPAVARAAASGSLSHVAWRCSPYRPQGAGGVDGVEAAQSVPGGEVAGVAGQAFVDRDGAQPCLGLRERGDCADVRRYADTARCTRCCMATPRPSRSLASAAACQPPYRTCSASSVSATGCSTYAYETGLITRAGTKRQSGRRRLEHGQDVAVRVLEPSALRAPEFGDTALGL